MKPIMKSILGGAAMLAATSTGVLADDLGEKKPADVSAALEARILNDMNRIMVDMYAENLPGSGVKIVQTGDVTLQPAGDMEYVVTFPQIRIETGDKSLSQVVTLDSAKYQLTFADEKAALKALASGDNIIVNLDALDAVPFRTGVTDGFLNVDLNGRCEAVQTRMDLGAVYSLDTKAADCSFKGELRAYSGQTDARLSSDAVFSGDFSKAADGTYSSAGAVLLTNLNLQTIDSPNGESFKLNVAKLEVSAGYSGQPSLTGKDVSQLGLADMPDGLSAGFALEGLSFTYIPESGAQQETLGPLSFGLQTVISGLKGNQASLNAKVNYDITDIEVPENLDFIDNVPEKSACTFDLSNVPVKDLADALSQMGMDGQLDLFSGLFAMDYLLNNSNLTLDFNCESMSGNDYRALFQGSHTLHGGAAAGAGSLEVYGYKKALEDLSALVGPDIAMLSQTFEQFAVPTADGKGKLWAYETDKDGGVTVNGTPLGPLMLELR